MIDFKQQENAFIIKLFIISSTYAEKGGLMAVNYVILFTLSYHVLGFEGLATNKIP